MSSFLQAKVQELEAEISRFRAERGQLGTLRQEREAALRRLQQEMRDFAAQRATEEANWEEQKQKEAKRVQRERRALEAQREAVSTGVWGGGRGVCIPVSD